MPTTDQTIFISYSRRDAVFANKLHLLLKASGIHPWIDQIELKPGDSLISKLATAVATSQFVLVVLSPNSVNSKWVQKELEIAMSVEIEEGRRFVIPILYKTCTLPDFLKPKLYIDFRSRSASKLDEAFQQLLWALDEMDRGTMNSPLQPSEPGKQFTEIIANDLKLKNTRWFRQFKTNPLVILLHETLRVRTLSDQRASELLLEFERVSHLRDGRRANGFLALAGFLSDVIKLGLTSHDICTLVRRIAEDNNVDTQFRRHTISKVPEIFNSVQGRNAKMTLLPQIFAYDFFDPLADELIGEFFSSAKLKKTAIMTSLWRLNVPSYRKEIVEYTFRTSNWKRLPRKNLNLHLRSEPEDLFSVLRPQWAGLWGEKLTKEQLHTQAKSLNEIISERRVDLRRLVEVSELLFKAKHYEAILTLNSVFDKRILDQLVQERSEGDVFKFLVHLTASRFVDYTTAANAFLEIVHRFGLTSLRCDVRFPGALLVPKANWILGGIEEASILYGIVDAAKDGVDWAILMIKETLSLFPQISLAAAVVETCTNVTPRELSSKVGDEGMKQVAYS